MRTLAHGTSAFGWKRTLGWAVIYVCFTPEADIRKVAAVPLLMTRSGLLLNWGVP
jgi:hypothetical protein